jgi:hypothetical protein
MMYFCNAHDLLAENTGGDNVNPGFQFDVRPNSGRFPEIGQFNNSKQ